MRSWKVVLAAAIAAGSAVGAYALLSHRTHSLPSGRSGAPAISVVTATVTPRDLPVVVEGIGTVQAYNTVTVRPRISGQIRAIGFTEGQRVRAGDVLARLDARLLEAQLEQAQAARLRDRASLENAREQLGRLESEGAQGYVSRQLIDSQRSQVQVLQATLLADQAAVRTAEVQLSYTVIRAPIQGITGIRLVDLGNVISPSDPGIVVITQVKPIAVIFTLPAAALAGLPQGRSAGNIAVAAFDPQDRAPLATGELALVDNQIDPASNTARLKAIFPNTDGALRPGEFVNVHLRKSLLRNVLTVPRQAIQYGPDGPFVWRLGRGSTVEPRPLEIGPGEGGEVEVKRGLSDGDRVVIEGQYGLHAGAAVRVQSQPLAPRSFAGSDLAVP